MGIGFKGESPIASVIKKGNKNNHQQQLYCTHGTFVKRIRSTENYLYVYLINMETNQLPVYFAIMKSVLPQVCTRYEIRNPVYHLPDIRHAFAQQSLKYCLIMHLNTEGHADMVHNTSFKNYKMDIKHKMINNFNAACTIRNCYVSELI